MLVGSMRIRKNKVGELKRNIQIRSDTLSKTGLLEYDITDW